MHIHPDDAQMAFLTAADPDQPIAMLNLLRFAEHANPGHGCDGMTGAEAYAEYGRRLREMGDAFPGTPIFLGQAEATVIGPSDETWDQVIVVTYPTLRSFLEMVTSPQSQEAAKARDAALADSRLVLTSRVL